MTAAELTPGTLVGGYCIEGVVGRGGMGVVYRATQLALERRVALKVIAPELADDEDFRERFRRESQLAATIDHPNVIPIHEAGEAEGLLFLAMRYVEGESLADVLKREGRLEPARATALLGQVAAALEAAHGLGLVHRDVKPANVLVGAGEHVYLTDFGLVRQLASGGSLTRSGQWFGTVSYAAPEQIQGERVDARADVYALGCVAFHCLCAQVPFERDNDMARMWAHAYDTPPVPSALVPELPRGFDDVVARAMAKRPEQRQGSAAEFGRELAGALAGPQLEHERPAPTTELLDAPPAPATQLLDGPPRPAPLPSRRRGRPLALIAAAVLAVAVLAAAGVLGATQLLAGDGDAAERRGAAASAPLKPLSLKPESPSSTTTSASGLTVEGRVSAGAQVSVETTEAEVSVDKAQARVEDGRYRARIGLAVGLNRIVIAARKRGHETVRKRLSITRSAPPSDTAPTRAPQGADGCPAGQFRPMPDLDCEPRNPAPCPKGQLRQKADCVDGAESKRRSAPPGEEHGGCRISPVTGDCEYPGPTGPVTPGQARPCPPGQVRVQATEQCKPGVPPGS